MRASLVARLLLSSCALVLLCAPMAAHADPTGDARKAFRAAMRDERWKERRAAYITLLDYDSAQIFEDVLDATMKEENAAVVLEGIKTLGQLESPEALAAFESALSKPRGHKGIVLLLASAEQKGAHGVAQLASILRGKDEQLATLAAAALGRKMVEPGLAPLIDALGHKDWHVVAAAARGLVRLAWSARTEPDKRTGEGPKPAMPAWFDGPKVATALHAKLAKAEGPARGAIIEALESITKKDYGDNPKAWGLHVQGKEPDEATLRRGRTHPAYFFGIPVHTRRAVVVLDTNLLTENEHPFRDMDRLKELCEVPGGRRVAWIKIRSIWQFNSAHVSRFLQDLPSRGTKFDLIFSGPKPALTFGRLTNANAGNKKVAAAEIEKAPHANPNDILGAMTAALDISGSKDSVAWTKGPDTVLCVYSSVPWEAPETDTEVIGATIGLTARIRGIQIHAVGVHEFAYDMLRLFAGQSDGHLLELIK
jgi:hypothetical protein